MDIYDILLVNQLINADSGLPGSMVTNVKTPTETYTVQKGDEIWNLAQKSGIPGHGLFSGISPSFEAPFDIGEFTFNRVDPITLDLDSDGIETTSLENGVNFDLDANGFAEKTAWVNLDDGLLVLDRNSNSTIDSGRELFGDQTLLNNGQLATSGYQALAEFDTNSDGKIDLNDTQFNDLKVLKGDGTLLSLTEAGIKSINLSYTNTNITDSNGNVQVKSGSYTKSDDTTGIAGEFNFNINTTNSLMTEWLDVPPEIEILPDAESYGTVYTLHQAMVRDTSGDLETLIESFVDETDLELRRGLMDQILADA